jgi:uncharacterized membrane protein YkvA (DUF1232 family)
MMVHLASSLRCRRKRFRVAGVPDDVRHGHDDAANCTSEILRRHDRDGDNSPHGIHAGASIRCIGTPMAGRLKSWARLVKRDVHALYLAARDPRVPWYAKALAAVVAGYALSPIDLIPDFIPVLGYLDDVILVPLGILLVVRLIPPEIMAEHRELAAAAQERPVSRVAAIWVGCAWVVSVALCGWLAYRYFVV